MIRILRTLDTLIFFVSKRSVMCTCIIWWGGVDMAFLKHVPLNVKAMFSIVYAINPARLLGRVTLSI
jgi:hypothetical protein